METVGRSDDMTDLTLVTYCGLFCGRCAHRDWIRQRSRELRDSPYLEQRNPSSPAIPKEFQSLLFSLARSSPRD